MRRVRYRQKKIKYLIGAIYKPYLKKKVLNDGSTIEVVDVKVKKIKIRPEDREKLPDNVVIVGAVYE